nr:G protein-coupled receptor [Proales similis]
MNILGLKPIFCIREIMNPIFLLILLSLSSIGSQESCTQFFYAENKVLVCQIRTVADMQLSDFNLTRLIDYREYKDKDDLGIAHFTWLALHFLSPNLILNDSFALGKYSFTQVWLYGLNAIDYSLSLENKVKGTTQRLYFNYGSLKTYSNGRRINSCKLNEIDTRKTGPFNEFSLYFEAFTFYEQGWCPLLLYKSNIYLFLVYGLKYSLIQRNLFSFGQVDQQDGNFWATIVDLKIYKVYQLHVTKELLSAQVLARTTYVRIWGVLKRIEPSALTQIDVNWNLILQNPREFFFNNPGWLSKLNYSRPEKQRFIGFYQYKTSSEFKKISDPYYNNMDAFYHFADSDFCLFATYPVNQTKYFFHIGSYEFFRCTCSILWLLKNYADLRETYSLGGDYEWDSANVCEPNKESIKSCRFEYRLSLCKFQTIRPIHETRAGPSQVEIVNTVLMVKYILVVIMQPFFCLVIFVLNILTFLVIRRMHRLKLPKKSIYMYENIGFNSMCHVVLSVLFGLQPLIECIAAPNGIFCNSLFINDAPRLFYLLGQSFLGNAAKLCSNLTMIAFSLHRFLINKDKTNSRLLRLFQNIKPKKMFAAIIFGSLILSSVKLFVNERLNLINFFIKKDFLYLVDLFGDGYNPNFLLSILFFVNQLFNDILANIIILYIDYKCYRIQVANTSKRSKILGQNQKMEEAIQNTNRMIIINGVSTAVLRAPEVLADLYKYQHTLFSESSDMCFFIFARTSSLCRNIYDISQFFYSLSGLLNFFLLFKFDGNFLASFRHIYSKNTAIRT